MKLAEALKIVQVAPPPNAENFSVYLACGFLPLHLATFLEANLRQLLPKGRIEIQTGLYGDLAGNLERLKNAEVAAGIVVFEWADFDPRLGLRSLGGWGPNVLAKIIADVESSARRFLQSLSDAAGAKPLAICLPTLALPPISYHAEEQIGLWQLQLTHAVNDFAVAAAVIRNIKILNQQQLDLTSPLAERLDVKSELSAGFPYRIAHAAKTAAMLARLIQPRAAKKGLITDLDDTFWHGLLGEDGIEGISWNLDQHSHIHALYQQLLMALSQSGVLIAVASKNDPALALKAFERDDLIMKRDHLFPFEVNWNAKSQSVDRVLQAWNVSPDSVVFVDDSPLELAEVKSVFPEIECLLFPRGDDQAAYNLLENLRDLFGKESILEEDAIRLDSIRRGAELRNQEVSASGSSADSFLEHVEAELTLSLAHDPSDARPLELINKTNQFNLNGRRLSKAEFDSRVGAHNAFVLLVAYKDKYGPLGKIAVMLGNLEQRKLNIDAWVMSCRAFSRHIEHKCLEYIFDKLDISDITFDYELTARNGPVREFLAAVSGKEPLSPFTLDRETFSNRKPSLHHKIKELIHA